MQALQSVRVVAKRALLACFLISCAAPSARPAGVSPAEDALSRHALLGPDGLALAAWKAAGQGVSTSDVPPLPADGERYRFTWLRAFDPPVVARLERDGDRVRADAVELAEPGRTPGEIRRQSSRQLQPIQWKQFENRLKASRAWASVLSGKAVRTDRGNDGADWIVEYWRGDVWEVVDLWSEQVDDDPAFRDACLFLVRMSGLDVQGSVY